MELMRKKIMLVDDSITNLMIGKSILGEKYDVVTISSGEKLFKLLHKVLPDLILLDVEMPEISGYEVIRVLKKQEMTANIPVIFLTARNDQASELEGLSLGAVDYISKPFSPPLLQKRIELHLLIEDQKKELKNYNANLKTMVWEKTADVLLLQNAIVQTMAELVESRDDVTGGHIVRTQYYMKELVAAMFNKGVYFEELSDMCKDDFFFQSSQLHDVGKITIKDSILMKPGRLTEAEFEEMKTHTAAGGKIIDRISEIAKKSSFLKHAKIFAETHHEKWDGRGYPNGLKGESIPLQGRLMAIVDAYDAITSERHYKKAMSHEQALVIIKKNNGSHFDPNLAELFIGDVKPLRD